MEYLSAREYAVALVERHRWTRVVSADAIKSYARQGRIPGARRLNGTGAWLLPADTPPITLRSSQSRRRAWAQPQVDPHRALQEYNYLVNHTFGRSKPRKRPAPYPNPEPVAEEPTEEAGELFMVFEEPDSGTEVAVPVDAPGTGQEKQLAAALGLPEFRLSKRHDGEELLATRFVRQGDGGYEAE